jgi:hypothetical protein
MNVDEPTGALYWITLNWLDATNTEQIRHVMEVPLADALQLLGNDEPTIDRVRRSLAVRTRDWRPFVIGRFILHRRGHEGVWALPIPTMWTVYVDQDARFDTSLYFGDSYVPSGHTEQVIRNTLGPLPMGANGQPEIELVTFISGEEFDRILLPRLNVGYAWTVQDLQDWVSDAINDLVGLPPAA